jgi:selenocysteine lyase/cysteine desulfurase
MAAVRGGNLRYAPHLYDTEDEVDQILAALP